MTKRITIFLVLTCMVMSVWAQLLPQVQQPKKNNEIEEQMRKFFMAGAMIQTYYVDSVDCKKMIEDAINGILTKLDPHSAYTNAAETKKFSEPLTGSFDGIGVQFNMLDDTLVVIQPVPKGPSEKVGILAGDRIVSVNDTAIAGVKMNRDEIMHRLRGPKGTVAHLGIVRMGIRDTLRFDVTRDKIPVNSVDAAYMVTPTIGFIRFNNFAQTTHDEIVAAIRKLQADGMKDLILDLQQNGGGYLQAAAEIASEFLPQNDLIVYTRGRNVPNQEYRSTGGGIFTEGKIAVLVDEYSASASEILSGAIQDQDRGIVVGRRTFGKGLVQHPFNMTDGSMIRLTVAQYYTPSGRCIQKPYEKGDMKSYALDVVNRYNKGELTNADSIHFPDSLRFHTLRKQRVVYGGGGIMPDYFVPLDTTKYSKCYRMMSAKGLLINANMRYIDKYRQKLKKEYDTFRKFQNSFELPSSVLDEIFAEAEKKDIRPADDMERTKTVSNIKKVMKALVARDLWDMNEYFAIIYEDDEVLLKAVELLSAQTE